MVGLKVLGGWVGGAIRTCRNLMAEGISDNAIQIELRVVVWGGRGGQLGLIYQH